MDQAVLHLTGARKYLEDHALELIGHLVPAVVDQYPDECRELVKALESLPLALQVAGRLLNTEYFDVLTCRTNRLVSWLLSPRARVRGAVFPGFRLL